jgi:hypothetical protein
MKIERRLSEGIGGWLIFEQLCSKTGVFSEKYLSFPIGQILSSVYGSNVHSEFIHPILKNHIIGPGAKPKVDFAVLNNEQKPIIAIETKWIGNSIPTVTSLMWDILRLGLLSQHFGTECIFLLGGRKRNLNKYFTKQKFKVKQGLHSSPILSTKSREVFGVQIITGKTDLINKWYKILSNWQSVEFPHRLNTQLFDPFPMECTLE